MRSQLVPTCAARPTVRARRLARAAGLVLAALAALGAFAPPGGVAAARAQGRAPSARPPETGPAGPPSVAERFAEEANPSHVLLVLDSRTGEIVRSEGGAAVDSAAFAPGETARVLFVLAGIEEGALDPSAAVACDSTCWADGAHGSVNLVTAIAYGCDTWFARHREAVDGLAIRQHALRAGFGAAVPSARAIDESEAFPGPGWGTTVREWAEFWREFPRGRLGRRSATTSTLLAGAATAVSSPRGPGRPLADPTRAVRAVVGETEEGAWVVGTRAVRGHPYWSYALFLRGGTASLAVARADHVLRETIRVWEHATPNRDREPPKPLDFRER